MSFRAPSVKPSPAQGLRSQQEATHVVVLQGIVGGNVSCCLPDLDQAIHGGACPARTCSGFGIKRGFMCQFMKKQDETGTLLTGKPSIVEARKGFICGFFDLGYCTPKLWFRHDKIGMNLRYSTFRNPRVNFSLLRGCPLRLLREGREAGGAQPTEVRILLH